MLHCVQTVWERENNLDINSDNEDVFSEASHIYELKNEDNKEISSDTFPLSCWFCKLLVAASRKIIPNNSSPVRSNSRITIIIL